MTRERKPPHEAALGLDFGQWSEWRPFPDPREGGYLIAPFGPGVYELRHHSTGQGILFGEGGNLAARMSSLLPEPLGCGTRRNEGKRRHVLEHLADVEYRTMATDSREDAKMAEAYIRARRGKRPGDFLFWT